MIKLVFLVSMVLSNLAIFFGLLLDLPPGNGAAWDFMTARFGNVMMAFPFGLVSVLALMGFKDLKYARTSLFWGSGLMVVWGLASFWAWIFNGAATPLSGLFLLHVAVMKYTLAIWAPRLPVASALAQKVDDDDERTLEKYK